MGTMKDIDVTSRGLTKGKVTVRPEAAGLVVEVDDEQYSGVWVRIEIDRDFLRALMVSCDAKESAEGESFNNGQPVKLRTRAKLILPDIPPQTPPLPDVPPGWPGS